MFGYKGEVSTIVYLMTSLMKSNEKKEPMIASSGITPGEEPPYRPLLTAKIVIEKGVYRSEVN